MTRPSKYILFILLTMSNSLNSQYNSEWYRLLIVGEQKFDVVQQFKYLGTVVTNDNNLDKEIRYRISLAAIMD